MLTIDTIQQARRRRSLTTRITDPSNLGLSLD
jgi:hypothetical protein